MRLEKRSSTRRRLRAALATSVALLSGMAALSPSASAAPGDPNSLQVVGQELFIFAPSGASNDTLFFTEPTPAADKPNVRPSFTPPGGNVSAQCVSDGVGGFNCTGVGNTALTAIHVFMGDGNDFVDWCCNGQGFSIKTDIDFGPGDDTALGDLVDDNPANLPQKGFEINGEAGRDFIVGTGTASGLPGDLLTGGEGDDTLISFPGDDTAHGGPGNDNLTGEQGVDVLNGEAGADTLNGGTENDTLSGGEGRDVISPGDGNDDISGDAGFDQVLYSDRTADEHVKVSLDDVANDGQDGETDNVRSNVEDIVGGAGNDTITGTAVANDLQGGAGNDTIEGGGGTDIFRGGTGDDNLLSRDGLPERIDCDAGADTAFSDTVDETNADCETVDASSTLDPDKDRDGFNTSPGPDCNDNDPNIKPGATDTPDDGIDQNCDGKDAQILDADNDGFTKDQDCDDNNPNARPDGTEVVGNNVDEDCDFFAAPFPIIESTVGNAIDTRGGVTKILQLFISNVPKGATVTVTCKGRGCPFRRKKTVAKKALRKVDYTRVFKKRRFRKGTRIVVQISKPGHVGRQLRITVGRSSVKKETLCLVPNQKAEQC